MRVSMVTYGSILPKVSVSRVRRASKICTVKIPVVDILSFFFLALRFTFSFGYLSEKEFVRKDFVFGFAVRVRILKAIL